MRSRVLVCLAPFAVLALLVSRPYVPRLLAATGCNGSLGIFGWMCETVDSTGDVGSLNQFAYGLDGVGHIAYTAHLSGGRTALKYARRANGGTWTTQVVDGSVGGAQAMLINPIDGRPAIGYGCLKVADYNGSTWSLQTVVKDCGQSAATFAFDPAGTLYAAHSDKRTWRLNVGKRMGSTWSFQALTPEASYMSMAIAPDGRPSIAFENRAKSLVYGHQQANGLWQFTTVDTAATLIYRVTLRFADDGTVAISYLLDDMVRLAMRSPGGGAWTIDTVPTRPFDYFDGLSLAFVNGDPVVVFGAAPGAYPPTSIFAALHRDTTGWSLATIEVTAATSSLSTRADYNPGTGLIGVSYGPRGSAFNDLKFAEGSPAVIGN